jgi:hypothetical protein
MSTDFRERYEQERQKRQQVSKGLGQYLDKESSSAFMLDDPWVENGRPVSKPVEDGGSCKIVIFGAGFTGLVAAIKCLESGAATSPKDIVIVDPAGGFGGTWYWNRYPGLMCDVERYVTVSVRVDTDGSVATFIFPY